jgi:protein arginine kinase activator
MICEICGKNEATIYLTKIVNENKEQLNICIKCAEKISGFNVIPDISAFSAVSFKNIFNGLMDYVYFNTEKTNKHNLICSNCGVSYSEFKEKGLLGCSRCYEDFKEALMPLIKEIQSDLKHLGKTPKSYESEILKNRLILQLKEELQRSIILEEYEQSAIIRDKIRKIENNQEPGVG